MISTAMPNIILVGSWMWPWYQEACARALTNCMVRLLVNSGERRTMELEARALAEG